MLSCINILSPEIQTPDSDFHAKLTAQYAEGALAKLFRILFLKKLFSTANHKICSNYICNESGSLCSLHLLLNTAFAFSLEKVPLTGISTVRQKANQNQSSLFSHCHSKRLFWIGREDALCYVFCSRGQGHGIFHRD